MAPSASEIYDRIIKILSWPIAILIFLCTVTVASVTFGAPGLFFGIAAGILLAKLAKPIMGLWPLALVALALSLARQAL